MVTGAGLGSWSGPASPVPLSHSGNQHFCAPAPQSLGGRCCYSAVFKKLQKSHKVLLWDKNKEGKVHVSRVLCRHQLGSTPWENAGQHPLAPEQVWMDLGADAAGCAALVVPPPVPQSRILRRASNLPLLSSPIPTGQFTIPTIPFPAPLQLPLSQPRINFPTPFPA